VTNFDRYLAKQMRSRRFRVMFWLAGLHWWAYSRLWRLTHRREAERLDRYVGER